MFDPATMFDGKSMPTFGGVPIAIYGLSGITLVLLTMLTFKSDLIMPDKTTTNPSVVETPKDNSPPIAEAVISPPIVEAVISPPIAEAVISPTPPMAEVVAPPALEKESGGKRRRTKSKKKKGKRKNGGTKRSIK